MKLTVFNLSPGHGMIIDEGVNVDAHWGRRLMALAQNNETVEKNCTEPGRRGHSVITVLLNIDTRAWKSAVLNQALALLVFPSLWYKNKLWTPLTSPSLLESASWRDYTIKILSAISQDYLHSLLRFTLLCFFSCSMAPTFDVQIIWFKSYL